jgi:branched-chain amino acid transport system ATP-binding protein
MTLVRQTAGDRGIGVLFTEHDMDAVFGYAHRIVVMVRGEIVASGPPAAVRADPLVRRVYLGEIGSAIAEGARR